MAPYLRIGALFLVLVLFVGILPMPASAAPPPVPTPQSPGYSTQFGEVISTLTPTLQWSSVSGANNYHVAIRQYSGSWDSGPIVLDKGYIYATSYTVPSGVLEAGASYRWNVEAYSSAGETSGWSSRLYFQTQSQATAPGDPTGLTATTVSESQINLAWNTPSGSPTNYKVYRGTSCGSLSLIFTTQTSGTTFQNTAGLNSGTTYCYAVSAVNSAGEGSKSNTASATTSSAAPQVPGAPSGLSASTVSESQISLAWNTPSGSPTNYKIYRGTSCGGLSLIFTTQTSGTTFQNTAGLNSGTTYCYAVSAVNSAGEGSKSNTASATTTTTPTPLPGAPSGLSAQSISATQIDLSWNSGSGSVANYKVYRGTSSGGESLVFTSQTTTPQWQNVAGLSCNTRYYYQVSWVNSAGEGPRSSEAYATTSACDTTATKPGMPTGLTPGQRSASGIDGELLSGLTANLAWSAPSGAVTKYKIYYRAEPYTATPSTKETTATSWATPALACGTTYRWQVEAYNGATVGDIAPSASERMYFTTKSCETLPIPGGTEQLGIDLFAPWPAGRTMIVGGPGYFYNRGTHTGGELYAVDINGPGGGNTDCGWDVLAVQDGEVVNAEPNKGGFGNRVKIAHEGGYVSHYAHLQDYLVSEGQDVRKGEPIGYLGSTGLSSGCHLHFTLYKDGASVPPSPMSGVELYDGIRLVSDNVPATEPQEPPETEEPAPEQNVPQPWSAGVPFKLLLGSTYYTAVPIHREGGGADNAWLFWDDSSGGLVDERETFGRLTQAALARDTFLHTDAGQQMETMSKAWPWQNPLEGAAFMDRLWDVNLAFLKVAAGASSGCIKGALFTGVATPAAVGGCLVGAGVVVGVDLALHFAHQAVVDLARTADGSIDCGKTSDRFIKTWASAATTKAHEATTFANHQGGRVESHEPMWAAYMEAQSYYVGTTYLRSNTETTRAMERLFDVAGVAQKMVTAFDVPSSGSMTNLAQQQGLELLVELSNSQGDCARIVEAAILMQRYSAALSLDIDQATREGAAAVQALGGADVAPSPESLTYIQATTPAPTGVDRSKIGGVVNLGPVDANSEDFESQPYVTGFTIQAIPSQNSLSLVRLVVNSTSHDGKIVIVNSDSDLWNGVKVKRIGVWLDDQRVPRAAHMVDLTSDPNMAKYLLTQGTAGYQVLVWVPHFSERTIEIATTEEAGQAFVTPLGITLMAAGALLVAGVAYGLGRRRGRGPSGRMDWPGGGASESSDDPEGSSRLGSLATGREPLQPRDTMRNATRSGAMMAWLSLALMGYGLFVMSQNHNLAGFATGWTMGSLSDLSTGRFFAVAGAGAFALVATIGFSTTPKPRPSLHENASVESYSTINDADGAELVTLGGDRQEAAQGPVDEVLREGRAEALRDEEPASTDLGPLPDEPPQSG